MLKYALNKYTSPAFHLFNLITSKLRFSDLTDGLCWTVLHFHMHPHYHKDYLVRILLMDNRKDEGYSAFVLCSCHCWLCEIWWESRTCQASRQTQRNGTVKLNLRKIRMLFWKEECVWSECWSDFALPHCRDTWYWYAGLSPPWSPGLASSQFKAPF